MKRQGPPLQSLTHRLAECPSDFLEEPGAVDAGAVVSDLSRLLGGAILTPQQIAPFRIRTKSERNRLRIALIACWLLPHCWVALSRCMWPDYLG